MSKQVNEWRIKDFIPYRIEKEHLLEHVAYLHHEVDPACDLAPKKLPIVPLVRDNSTPKYLRKKGTNEIFIRTDILAKRKDMKPYNGPIAAIQRPNRSYLAEAIEYDAAGVLPPWEPPLPDEVWLKIKETYRRLLAAKDKGTLPTQAYKVDADDLRKFFTKMLRERPKFLFPEEREKELAPTEDKRPPFEHSNDFRSIKMENGEILNPTKNQAKIISMLYKASPRSLSSSSLLEELYANKDNGGASESNLKKAVFKKHPHIYESLIESTGQGLHRLKPK